MESYFERRKFKEITDGLESEIADPFSAEKTDGWDPTPRPSGLEDIPDTYLPKGHIALQGDFERPEHPPSDPL